TENAGTFSYTGSDFSYNYTVSGDVASVIYPDTLIDGSIGFTVTRTMQKAYYSDLKVSIDGGEATTLDGFLLNKQDYTLALSPDNYSVEFSGTVGAGTSDIDTVNANINYNGANTITVTGDDSSTFAYTITISRDRSDVLPQVCGQTITGATQTIYVDEVPATVSADDIVLTYPNGAEKSNVAYSGGVVTFTLTDKAVGTNTTNYSVTIKSKMAGQIGYWDLNETSGTSYAGKAWDETTQSFKSNSSLTMYTHVGGHQTAPTSARTKTAPASVDGKLGKGIQLANWGYTEGNMPTAANSTGFTFSTWMKTSGIVWEAIFAVYNKDGSGKSSEGVIFEKGHMQWPRFDNGVTSGSYGGNFDPGQATWKSGLNSEDARKNYFNSSSDFVLYTVTVSYVNGVGVVKFYKNGELAATYDNTSDGNTVAQRTIGALNNGGYIGLHRHIYDGGQQSTFDDVRMFAYAMTDSEVAALHSAYGNVTAVGATSIATTGITGYPDVKFATSDTVTVESGVGTGVRTNGVKYSYTLPSGNPVSKATDKVNVTVYKDNIAYISRTVEVTFTRTFDAPTAATLGYKIGSGASQSLAVQATQNVTVPGNVDLTQANAITKGDCSAVEASGATASAYNIAFAYTPSTKTATYTVTYSDYTDIKTVYTVTFANQKYTVTYNLNGATGTAPAQVTDIAYGTKLTAPTEPAWTGHVFKGWYKDADCTAGQEWDFENDTVTADATLYAKWATGYAITYYDGSEALTFAGKNGYEAGVALTLPSATKTGYTFIGWYESSDLSGTAVTEITSSDEGDKTYYAKFEANTYTITWDANGGTFTGDTETEIDYDSDLVLPTPPTLSGYTFLGWFTDLNDDTTQVTAGKWTIAENVTLYAKYTETMYTVTFNLQDGSTNATVQVAEGGTVTEPADPTRGGYRFEGWYGDAACTAEWDFDTPITADVTIYAKWTQVFTVVYELNGGSGVIESVTVDYGEKISAPATEPTRSGYTFGGWYKDVA
ncbi:MAG: InlB B-repeat-containing protein, partial [Clostridiales bacterium]|nr:InlB B-repeat-containing protein [Clostridiales bacterium]